MAFLIVLNKEPYFLIGLLSFLISNGNLFFRFMKNGSLDHLVIGHTYPLLFKAYGRYCSPSSKCGSNDIDTISKILIIYGRYSYYLYYSHDYIM
jgi:hypothetical protein